MRAWLITLLCIFMLLCIVTPAFAADEERYSYIAVREVVIQLRNDTAIININYTVDDGTKIIFFLLGKQDLRNKLNYILNYNETQIRHLDLDSAEFVVERASYSYGKGIFWYPTHEFNIFIPSLTVQSPQVTRNFSMTKIFPDGIGYFDVGENHPAELSDNN